VPNPTVWQKPFTAKGEDWRSITTFGTLDHDTTKDCYGLETYLDRYGTCKISGMDLNSEESLAELKEWSSTVCFENEDPLEIICCPEDRRCQYCEQTDRALCAQCEVPLCNMCSIALKDGYTALPASTALANDMMIYYAPKSLYEDELTVMEMICCSPCIASLICFSMEVKYGHMLDSQLHMQRHRVGARGNSTSFILPWEALLKEFHQAENARRSGGSLQLPRYGEELSDVVEIRLKANDEESRTDMKKFIHQAKVRRQVVV